MKIALAIEIFLLAICPLSVAKNDLEQAKHEFTNLRGDLAGPKRTSDILFLLDTSGSLSSSDFNVEKKFVTNFLNMITVSIEAARVEVIPFGDKASRYIDGVSSPSSVKHKCHLNDRLKNMSQSINGWLTNTKDAFKLAYDVCLGVLSAYKRPYSFDMRTVVIFITDGYATVPFNDPNPVSDARRLYETGKVEVFAIGVGYVGLSYIRSLVKDPAKQAFHLQNFNQLQELSLVLKGGK